ncbi:unnamed protein product [Soboliphyme baturini]|uniref:tetrahydrofolate synthase n=1 Tax=Soboliphyme baturini TaxID=241478 RepID=A0A183IW66_9BILA|nr:unnamed protein product [Soboliphyme baturini]
MLGHTIEEIATHKAGIMKTFAPVVTVPQPPQAMAVLVKQSQLVNCPLYVVPPLQAYLNSCAGDTRLKFGIPGPHQDYNVSMALQLTRIWRSFREGHEQPFYTSTEGRADSSYRSGLPSSMLAAGAVTEPERLGIEECSWPGRCQIVRRDDMVFYLDGAHTPLSIQYTSQWFDEILQSYVDLDLRSVYKVLVFHCTYERSAVDLLAQFQNLNFDLALFCPPVAFPDAETSADVTNYMVSVGGRMKKCLQNRCAWLKLIEERRSAAGESTSGQNIPPLSSVVACVSDAVSYIELLKKQVNTNAPESPPAKMHVLVTGSLHLVGSFLQVLNWQSQE